MLRTSFALFAVSSSTLAQCPDWSTTYLPPGADRGVFSVEHHDDGTGERLYVGGFFERIGDQLASGVARWNGASFEPVGASIGSVLRLHSLDDGSGPALYAVSSVIGGATFRWDGANWTQMPAGTGTGELAVFDDGTGPALYSAGAGSSSRLVRRFNGTSWVDVGTQFDRFVIALEVFDDGTGPALYAAGEFRSWNGVPCEEVARWTGTAWVQVGNGLGTHYGLGVQALCVHDDGAGPRLIAGGIFDVSGSVFVSNVAAWDGTAWSPMGAGVTAPALGSTVRPVRALESADAGGVHRLFAAGDLDAAEGSPAQLIAAWDGSTWSPVATGIGGQSDCCTGARVYSLSTPSSGGDLTAGGFFERAGEAGARNLARWDGTSWSALVAGQSLDGLPRASTVHDDGTGRKIYVGGNLNAAGNAATRLVARFDGTTWENVGPFALDQGEVRALASIDLGAGPRLYAGGTFSSISGSPWSKLAYWDGTQWNDVPGIDGISTSVDALLADTSGLYVGGSFNTIGGISAFGIAKYDGQTWSTFGSGLGQVRALAFFDSGSGRELYAGGDFPGRIAHWNGSTWVYVPQPPSGSGGNVYALEPYFDGTSERLFVGGNFSQVGGFNTINIASWNGTAWTAYGFGTSGYVNSQLRGFRVFDDGLGAGPKLFACGYFSTIQNQVGFSVIGFDGTTWQAASPNGGIANGTVETLDVLEDATGASLFAFGQFEATNSALAWGIARYGRHGLPGCEPVTGVVFCDGSGAGAACPCGNVGAASHGCNNSSATGGAALTALGQANVPADTVTLRATGMPATTACLFFQGTSSPAGGAGAVFGDGIRCVSGAQIRLVIRAASGGVAQFGDAVPGDPAVSEAGGVFVAATRTYQVWYRDAQSFCSPSTFNLSNGLRIRWAP